MPKKKIGLKKVSSRKDAIAGADGKSGNGGEAGKARPTGEDEAPVGGGDRFPIVGIGASAGGLEALEEFFQAMPLDSGMGFVVMTHQHPGHASLLPEILGKKTAMPVAQVVDGTKVEPNHVYVGTSEGNLAILNDVLHQILNTGEQAPCPSVDYFFRSLAEDLNERAIGIILSGTGSDGTLGVKAIKAASGMVMAQQLQSAKYAGMPSSAIATGLVDYILTPSEMPEQLIAYVRGPYLTGAAVAAEAPAMPVEPMQKIFVLLRSHTGHDFSGYKINTIRRRIERRMNVHQIKSPDQYVRYIQENLSELDDLFKELLISVTYFFRDEEAWESLLGPLERLIKTRPENDTLRVWVPGCATGEEAYSIAILLREAMERIKRFQEVQIYGTDLDSDAIKIARGGRYPAGIAGDVSPERLEHYFLHEDGGYRVRKEVREMAIFAQQNVIKDPPFIKLDLISCRNLLIYLNTDLQRRLLPIFHYALKPGGLLFLGSSETVGALEELFEPVDKRWKIFRRKEGGIHVTHPMPAIPAQYVPVQVEAVRKPKVSPPGFKVRRSGVFERLLLNQFAPASVVVNANGDLIYVHGHTGMYLEPAQGSPSNNVLEMAREGLKMDLSGAIRECLRSGANVTRSDIRVRTNGGFHPVGFAVTKLQGPEALDGLLLISFRSCSDAPPGSVGVKPAPLEKRDGGSDTDSEQELKRLWESHQNILEELETANEELMSANEELQSTNEELQSTNEELETSKEEMQSLNEELTTVNAELESKVDELSRSHDDMQNLLNSTDIATIFVDNNLNIKRFTDPARELVMLRPSDMGRPLSELASQVDSPDLAAACREVLRTLVFKEEEIWTTDGGCYLMRIVPYRTGENVIDGLVLTFVNIGQVKEAEDAGEKARTYFESIVDTVREPLIVLNGECRVVSANKAYYRLFRSTPRQTEGEIIYETGSGQWDVPILHTLLEERLKAQDKFEDCELEIELPRLGPRNFLLNARRIEPRPGASGLILLALEDMTSGAENNKQT